MISESRADSRGITLVTGGADRVTAAICEHLARAGKRRFVFLGRSEAKLIGLREKLLSLGSESDFVECDLGSSQAIQELSLGPVEFLLLGASPAEKKPFLQSERKKLINIAAVSCTAMTALLAKVLPTMSPAGRVLVLSSTAAFQPGPGNATYFAAKAFQNALAEAITFELKDSGPRFLVLCPGPLPSRADGVAGPLLKRLRSVYLEDVLCGLDAQFERGTLVWVPGKMNQLFRRLVPVLPRAYLLGKIHRLMRAI